MRKKLKLDTLVITSFETGSALALSVTGDSESPECANSPLCGPTAYKTCEDCPAGLGG